MGHEQHYHEKQPLTFFASPLENFGAHHGKAHELYNDAKSKRNSVESDDDLERGNEKNILPSYVESERSEHAPDEMPVFQRHAEATTAELFYDLFFVANLTTFTSNLEINDNDSLLAYIGFFALLWFTWYQVTLYDVRFSTDSVFERIAKGIHFGVMIGFAVIGPQWKPGFEVPDYHIYKAFGWILMVSRITLFCQYTVTLCYTKKYRKTIIPLLMVMQSTLTAAILYGGLVPAFPGAKFTTDPSGKQVKVNQVSNVYIAWYIIAFLETLLTVAVSIFMRVISFKGTHMVQRMSLLTLIILGEGIIVVGKSISKIVKNEKSWSASMVGQIIAAILIIYFLYMTYFDQLHEEHFGSIRQQIWSVGNFFLHISMVLVLQGVSILIIFRQAVEVIADLEADIAETNNLKLTNMQDYVSRINNTLYERVFNLVPKGVESAMEEMTVRNSLTTMVDLYDSVLQDNATSKATFMRAENELYTATFKTMFDSLGITIPKKKSVGQKGLALDFKPIIANYYHVFELVVSYVFIAGGAALILNAIMGWLLLPPHKRTKNGYIRLAINGAAGVGLCLVTIVRVNDTALESFMATPMMIPTICIVMFLCVLVNHVRLPKRKARKVDPLCG